MSRNSAACGTTSGLLKREEYALFYRVFFRGGSPAWNSLASRDASPELRDGPAATCKHNDRRVTSRHSVSQSLQLTQPHSESIQLTQPQRHVYSGALATYRLSIPPTACVPTPTSIRVRPSLQRKCSLNQWFRPRRRAAPFAQHTSSNFYPAGTADQKRDTQMVYDGVQFQRQRCEMF